MRRRSRLLPSVLSLRAQLILFAIAALAPLLALTGILIARSIRAERAAVGRGLADSARALSSAVDREIAGTVTALEALAASRSLDLGDMPGLADEASRVLRIRAAAGWVNIRLASPGGAQILSVGEPNGASPDPDPVTLAEAIESRRVTISNVARSPITGDYVWCARVPVARHGAVQYVVTAVVAARSMAAALAPVDEGRGDRIAVLYDRRQAIVHRTLNADRLVGSPITPKLAERSRTDAFGIVDDVNREGTPIRTAFHRSALSGWGVGVGLPHAVLYAPARRSLLTLAGATGAILLVSAALIVVLEQRIRRPIVDLAHAATTFTASGATAPIATLSTAPGAREIEALASAFVAAAHAIEADRAARQRLDDERLRALAAERTARGEAETASRAKDEFLAMLAHELRNPLAAIVSGIAVLDRIEKPDENAMRVRDLIRRQSAHLARLVDDLLDVGRVMTGKIQLNRARIEFADAVRRSVAMLSGSGRTAHHRVTVDAEPAWVEADPVRLEQIVGNLLANALKFTPQNGQIRISVRPEGTQAVLRVEDTGIGIAAELLPRVFDLFVQGPMAPERAPGGLGIGLTLVRRLTELHGGSVEARSPGPGKGSTFVVRLPLVSAPATWTVRADAPAPVPRRRVVIVEDQADARETLRMLLELEGHEVHEQADGAHAADAILALRANVAFVDIGLPGIDGYEVARRVRAHPAGHDVVLVALTGYGAAEDVRRAREAGFDLHIVKPADPANVVRAVAAARADGPR